MNNIDDETFSHKTLCRVCLLLLMSSLDLDRSVTFRKSLSDRWKMSSEPKQTPNKIFHAFQKQCVWWTKCLVWTEYGTKCNNTDYYCISFWRRMSASIDFQISKIRFVPLTKVFPFVASRSGMNLMAMRLQECHTGYPGRTNTKVK